MDQLSISLDKLRIKVSNKEFDLKDKETNVQILTQELQEL
jgi:hypothetical protein